jgi:hypothetical protein
MTAENVGDGPGTFRGAANFSFPMYRSKGFDNLVVEPNEKEHHDERPEQTPDEREEWHQQRGVYLSH